MYGGRAIDSFDRRVLNIYMNEYMGDFIFDTFQPFHFFHNDEVDYFIPEGSTKDVFVGKQEQFSRAKKVNFFTIYMKFNMILHIYTYIYKSK